MNKELMDALNVLEKEKNISKDTLLGAIEQSLIQACKNHFGKADNVHVMINPETCDFSVYAEREVKEFVEDPALEISLTDAQKINANAELGDVIKVQIQLSLIKSRKKSRYFSCASLSFLNSRKMQSHLRLQM